MARQLASQKNVQLLQQSMKILSDTQQLGCEVLNDLTVQGETIDRISEGVTAIEENQTEAAEITIGMSSWWSRLTAPFRLIQLQPAVPKGTPSKKVVIITETNQSQLDEEALLSQISGSVENLKSTVTQIGKEISYQNGKLDHLNNRVGDANTNMKRLDRKITSLS